MNNWPPSIPVELIDVFDQFSEGSYFQECPQVNAELGELVTGQKPGRENDQEKSFAANLGLAMDGMAVAPLIYQRATNSKTGT